MNRNTLSKFKTTLLERASRSSSNSSSMHLPGSPRSPAGSNVPTIEFPTSPHPAADAGGEDITHYSHPKHPLAQMKLPELFVCGGCKEYGAGNRFTCKQCDFQLHEFCALSPPSLRGHPLHGQHQLVLHSRPKRKQAGIAWPKCDICGKSSTGFTVRCRACSFQMHPCCAMLSTEMTFPGAHPHSLKLLPLVNQPVNGDPTGLMECGECKRKRSGGRMYRCMVCDYHLHAVCAKSMINGLQANGITAPEKPRNSNMLGTAARLASQVVIEFIGGLIEGFGEGVGEALVQSIARGRRRNEASATAPSSSRTVATTR